VLDCPGGTFQGAGVKTVVLFFEKGAPTRKVWYYQLDPGRNLGKTNPLNDADLAEFVALQKTKADSPKSWSVDAATIDPKTFDLSVKNPNGGEEIAHRSPQEIMDEIARWTPRAPKCWPTPGYHISPFQGFNRATPRFPVPFGLKARHVIARPGGPGSPSPKTNPAL
jgi:hypothetical protein